MTNIDMRQRGRELFSQGRYEEAVLEFEESLRFSENSEIWNDWAAAQAAAGRLREAGRGFQRALRLNPKNATAASNLRFVTGQKVNPTAPSTATAAELHQAALEHYNEGKYKEALDLIERALKSGESSQRWNDFAVVQLAVKNFAAAELGYRRALELDPANHLAAANLVALLETLGRDAEASQFLSAAGPGLVEKNREAALLAVARLGNKQLLASQLFKHLSRLPEQDPALPVSMAEALGRSRNSGYLARQCCALLTRVPPESRDIFLEAFRLFSINEPKFHSALALWHMSQGDCERALEGFHKVFDSNPADLFAESMIIDCEHRRHATCPAPPDPFEGIEAYLRDRFCENPWKHFEIGVQQRRLPLLPCLAAHVRRRARPRACRGSLAL